MPTFSDDPVVSSLPTTEGAAISGDGANCEGVRGTSHSVHAAVVGINDLASAESGQGGNGGWFQSTDGEGVRGWSQTVAHGGVVGLNSAGGWGVYGRGENGHGVVGESAGDSYGVYGKSDGTGSGVVGEGNVGVHGTGRTWIGVYGESNAAADVGAAAVWGDGKAGADGVKGVATGVGKAAVCGFQLGNNGPGVFGQGAPAGRFEGDVVVTGDVILQGADYAEALTVSEVAVTAGMVVVLDDEGRIRPCTQDHDSRVAGVVSGGGGVKAALVLDRHDGGAPVALLGKVWAMADATCGAIRPGDLLTSTTRPGHAQRLTDPARGFGAVVGRALTPLEHGQGMVRVLVSST